MLDVDLLALNMLILHYFWKVKKRFEEPNTMKSVYMISFFFNLSRLKQTLDWICKMIVVADTDGSHPYPLTFTILVHTCEVQIASS